MREFWQWIWVTFPWKGMVVAILLWVAFCLIIMAVIPT